ncbi:MAG: M56 family metallopeptidase [Truepera sp.]|nr:M56 family metallopeptidase [Truepera sp.]
MLQTLEVLGWVLIHSLWQGALIALLLAALLTALWRHSSQVRYAADCAALALALLAPAVTFAVHVVAITPPLDAPSLNATELARLYTPLALSPLPSGDPLNVSTASPEWPVTRTLQLLGGLWLAGATLLLLRLFVAWVALSRFLRHKTTAAPPEVAQALRALAREAGIAPTVIVRQSAHASVPFVCGLRKPTILLPTHVIASLTSPQLTAILAHELAHIRRRDYLINLLQHTAEALLFFHPAVWWLSNQLRIEREHCCDDLVVSELRQDLHTYLEALVKLPQLGGLVPRHALAAAKGTLVTRVRRLVAKRPGSFSSRRVALILAVTAALLTGYIAYSPPNPAQSPEAATHIRVTMAGATVLAELDIVSSPTGIDALPPGTRFILEQLTPLETLRVQVEPNGDGSLAYRFFRNNAAQAFEETAQAWFSRMLADVLNFLTTLAPDALQQIGAIQERSDVTISLIMEPASGRSRHLLPLSMLDIPPEVLTPAFFEVRLLYALQAASHGLGTEAELRRFLEDLARNYGVPFSFPGSL